MRIRSIAKLTSILITSILICGCSYNTNIPPKDETNSSTGVEATQEKGKDPDDSDDIFDIRDIESFIKKADSLKNSFSTDIKDTVIGKKGDTDILEIKENYTFTQVMETMGEYFTDNVAELELNKIQLANLNGRIGFIAASGESYPYLTEDSRFKLLVDEKDTKLIEVEMSTDYDENIKVLYILEKFDNNKWKIVNQVNSSDSFDKEFTNKNWPYVKSSSYMQDNKFDYSPKQVIDGMWDTAWVEAASGDGIGEWIEFKSDSEHKAVGIKLVNGYTKSKELYEKNNRVKKVKIEFSDGSSIIKDLQDVPPESGISTFQEIYFGRVVITSYIKLTILDVYKGSKYDDTCFSEIRVF